MGNIPWSPNIQSHVQIRASTVSGLRALRYWSSTLPPILNDASDVTVDIGIDSTSRAKIESSGYRNWFAFQKSRTFKFIFLSTLGSSKYNCNCDFWEEVVDSSLLKV